MSINKVLLLGRLGQDPELKYTPSGKAVCSFSLATSDSWKDKSGQKQEKTEWHRVVVWGKLAELCNQYLAKGRQAFVEGKLSTRQWEDKQGNKRYTTEINASSVQFIGGGKSSDSNYDSGFDQSGGSQTPEFDEPESDYNVGTDTNFASDDIPF